MAVMSRWQRADNEAVERWAALRSRATAASCTVGARHGVELGELLFLCFKTGFTGCLSEMFHAFRWTRTTKRASLRLTPKTTDKKTLPKFNYTTH